MSRPFALVTGASSGIGLALAHELAGSCYDLAICSAGGRLESAAESLRSSGAQVLNFTSDLSTSEGVKHFWQQSASSAAI
jgi:uncharacterized protein